MLTVSLSWELGCWDMWWIGVVREEGRVTGVSLELGPQCIYLEWS